MMNSLAFTKVLIESYLNQPEDDSNQPEMPNPKHLNQDLIQLPEPTLQ